MATAMSAKTILITGASSGIGAELARAYAAPGVKLVLWGRNQGRLEATAEACRGRGASVVTACFDIVDFARLVAELEAVEAHDPVDLAIFNAGLGGALSSRSVAQDVDAAERMAAVNFTAPVVGANWLAARMAGRGRGRIVFVSSIAESFPLPTAPLYAGSKAGLAMFAEALRLRLKPHGVGVTLVSPGFVDTPMSRGLGHPRPFLISADDAAAIIARRVNRGAARIVVPWQFAVLRAAAALVPRAVVRAVLSHLSRAER